MVGRFQVMALLQAARAKALGYRLDEAESFGLNRAIFYAAAKRGFQGGTSSKHAGEQHVLREIPGRSIAKTIQQDALGDEVAYYVEMDGKKQYVMGEEILEPGDFRRQVAERFGQAFPRERMPGIAQYVPLAAFPSLFNKRQKREGTAIEEPPKNTLILLP